MSDFPSHDDGARDPSSGRNYRWLAGFAVALALLAAVQVLNWRYHARTQELAKMVAHTHLVQAEMNRLQALVEDVENKARGYIATGDAASLSAFAQSQATLAVQRHRLEPLVYDPSLESSLAIINPLIMQRVADLQHSVELRKTAGFDPAWRDVMNGPGKIATDKIRTEFAKMDGRQRNLLEERSMAAKNEAESTRLFTITGTVASFCMLLAIIALVLRENALRRRMEAERDRFFNISLDMLCISHADGYFKRLNPAFTETLGWSIQEMLARPLMEFVHPDDHAVTLREIERQVASGKRALSFENRYRHKNGSWRTLEWRSVPQPGGFMYATARDVTDIKAAVDSIRASEENLSVTLRSIGDGVLTTDAERRITRLNPVAEKLTGWPEGEALGRLIEDVFHIIDERTRQPGVIPVDDALRSGVIRGLANHTALIARDGTERSIADSCAPIRNREGRIMGAVLVFRDNTLERAAEVQLLKSRALFENLFTSLPGLFLVLTSKLEIVTASDAYLKATMTKRGEIVGRPLFEVLPDNPDDPEASGAGNLRESLDRVLSTQAADIMAIQKYDIRRPDGIFEERHWSPINSPVLNSEGEIEYIIHRVEDVTDFVLRKSPSSPGADLRVRMEQMEAEMYQSSRRVQAANQQLEAANKELESFSYSVSHDLRAPLRHVQGYVEMLAKTTEGQLSPKAARYVKIITEASSEMGQLIDDLLAFCRMGRTEMLENSVAMNGLVEDTLKGMELALKDRNIVWKIASLPAAVGDTAMLRQVYSNLLGNAVKYSRNADPAVIEVGCAGLEEERGVFFVRDNGVGFDMEYAHKLFGIFQRLHRADEFEGTGIGLANVRRIVSRHGGRTWAEAALNRGATIYFTLKLAGRNGSSISKQNNHE